MGTSGGKIGTVMNRIKKELWGGGHSREDPSGDAHLPDIPEEGGRDTSL